MPFDSHTPYFYYSPTDLMRDIGSNNNTINWHNACIGLKPVKNSLLSDIHVEGIFSEVTSA